MAYANHSKDRFQIESGYRFAYQYAVVDTSLLNTNDLPVSILETDDIMIAEAKCAFYNREMAF